MRYSHFTNRVNENEPGSGISVGDIENVLFNDAHNIFYLWFYGIGHMVKDHSLRLEPAATNT